MGAPVGHDIRQGGQGDKHAQRLRIDQNWESGADIISQRAQNYSVAVATIFFPDLSCSLGE